MKHKRINRLLALAALLAAWHILSVIWRTPIIPSPWAVFNVFFEIFFSKLAVHALYSMWRIAAGITLSLIIGIPFGLCMGYFEGFDRLFSPVVYFLYPIPKIALLPVVMLLMGLGEASKITMIVIIIVFQIIVTVRDAVKSIPKEMYYSLISLGARRSDIFKNIIIPASLPEVVTSTRVGLGTAISVLFFTETFGTEYGIGYFIMDAWMRVNYLEMYSGIVMLSAIGFVVFSAIDAAEYRLCRWK
ncbi:ABC transporter permease [Mahella sp.]|uniref:ABC transporter permease n=1 Tax=Mahella sp. TaxID=2798721 RepID=UPI0025BD6E80|nr:ABC transporter permease [Mahella sp.]MBZ4665689.1 binding-protein-dependent transport system inner rane component [Mahella sp.]MDK2903068.1 NitT/TauT family transport system permease protein [Clostridiales bacterium]